MPVRSHCGADTLRYAEVLLTLKAISPLASLRLRHLQTDLVGVMPSN